MNDYRQTAFKGFALKIYKGTADPGFLEKCCRKDPGNGSAFAIVTSSKHSRVYTFTYEGRDYYYKAFLNRNTFESFKALFRGNRAKRALRGDQLLLRHGFNVPRCILIGRKGAFNFSVSEAAGSARNLSQFVREELSIRSNRQQGIIKKRLINGLGRAVGRLHARKIIHGDLRWGNILIEETSPGELSFWFLDNERTALYSRNLPRKKRLKNLVQINMTLNPVITGMDRLLFLNAYLLENPELCPYRDELAAEVKQLTEDRLAKYNERGS